MAPIDGESLELEVKHKDNGSWHPCRVSLSWICCAIPAEDPTEHYFGFWSDCSTESKFGIVIDFENSNEGDIISCKEDALARLRFRSTPLQDGECSHIKEGDSVLALYKDQFRSMFFDAVIEKPNRVKHSNRVFCRCTFEIKWLNPELNGETVTIPSKSIMKLSREEIDSHPIFAAFLNALTPTDGRETSSPLLFLEETDYDADLQGVLEEQIEQISKFADESIESSADLLEFKRANFGRYKQKKSVATLRVSSNNHQNNFRRSTRSQTKEQTKVELKNEPEEDKPFLSPLAARAALASLVHERELPLTRELSFPPAVKRDQEILFQRDSKKHIEVDPLGLTYEYMKCGSSSWASNLSNTSQIGDDDRHVDSRGISRHSNQRGRAKDSKPKESPSYLEKPSLATEGSTVSIVSKSIGSSKFEKLNGRPMTTRVAHPSVHKETEVSPDEVNEGSSTEKLTNPVNTRKTRSSAHKETEASLDVAKQISSTNQKLTCPVICARVTRSRNQKEQRTQEVHQETEISDPIQDTHGVSVKTEGEKESSTTIDSATVQKLSGPTRVTRSAVHKEIEASSVETKQGSSSKKITSKNKRSSSPVDLNTESSHGVNKRTRASHAATITTEDSRAFFEDDEDDASVEKKKADIKKTVTSKKPQPPPPLRSSPRFQFLPRTRSQKNA